MKIINTINNVTIYVCPELLSLLYNFLISFRLQAYGVLDKYKISKTFFVKTDQAECAYLDLPEEQHIEEEEVPEKRKRKPQPAEPSERSAIAPNDADIEIKEKEKSKAEITGEKALSDIPKIIADEPTKLEQPIETVPERILKIAEVIKEDIGDPSDMIIVDVKEENVAENPEQKSEQTKKTEASA